MGVQGFVQNGCLPKKIVGKASPPAVVAVVVICSLCRYNLLKIKREYRKFDNEET